MEPQHDPYFAGSWFLAALLSPWGHCSKEHHALPVLIEAMLSISIIIYHQVPKCNIVELECSEMVCCIQFDDSCPS